MPRTRSMVPLSEVRPFSRLTVRSMSDTERKPCGNSPFTSVPFRWISAERTVNGDSERRRSPSSIVPLPVTGPPPAWKSSRSMRSRFASNTAFPSTESIGNGRSGWRIA